MLGCASTWCWTPPSSSYPKEAKRDILRRQVQQRFGAVSALEQRPDMAAEPELDTMLDHVFIVSSAEEL
jgi:hypothetical protein